MIVFNIKFKTAVKLKDVIFCVILCIFLHPIIFKTFVKGQDNYQVVIKYNQETFFKGLDKSYVYMTQVLNLHFFFLFYGFHFLYNHHFVFMLELDQDEIESFRVSHQKGIFIDKLKMRDSFVQTLVQGYFFIVASFVNLHYLDLFHMWAKSVNFHLVLHIDGKVLDFVTFVKLEKSQTSHFF